MSLDLNNITVGGALAFGGLSAAFFQLVRQGWNLASTFVIRSLTSSLVVHDDEPELFNYVSKWANAYITFNRHRALAFTGSGEQDFFTPADGFYLIRYQSRRIRLVKTTAQNGGHQGRSRQSYYLTMLGSSSAIFDALVKEGKHLAQPRPDKLTVLMAGNGYWEELGYERKRPLHTVALNPEVQERLLADLERFQQSKERYYALNIPYRRGYLLHGPPGNGKTSLIKAVAALLNLPIYILNLANKEITDSTLSSLLGRLQKGIVVLEDVDSVLDGREIKGRPEESGLTFSGVLNALDGILAPEGRIIFMTSNHPEKLDPALVRPGRIDLQLELPNAGQAQLRNLFTRFHPDISPEQLVRLQQLPEGVFSVVTVQDALLSAEGHPQAVLQAITELETLLRDTDALAQRAAALQPVSTTIPSTRNRVPTAKPGLRAVENIVAAPAPSR